MHSPQSRSIEAQELVRRRRCSRPLGTAALLRRQIRRRTERLYQANARPHQPQRELRRSDTAPRQQSLVFSQPQTNALELAAATRFVTAVDTTVDLRARAPYWHIARTSNEPSRRRRRAVRPRRLLSTTATEQGRSGVESLYLIFAYGHHRFASCCGFDEVEPAKSLGDDLRWRQRFSAALRGWRRRPLQRARTVRRVAGRRARPRKATEAMVVGSGKIKSIAEAALTGSSRKVKTFAGAALTSGKRKTAKKAVAPARQR